MTAQKPCAESLKLARREVGSVVQWRKPAERGAKDRPVRLDGLASLDDHVLPTQEHRPVGWVDRSAMTAKIPTTEPKPLTIRAHSVIPRRRRGGVRGRPFRRSASSQLDGGMRRSIASRWRIAVAATDTIRTGIAATIRTSPRLKAIVPTRSGSATPPLCRRADSTLPSTPPATTPAAAAETREGMAASSTRPARKTRASTDQVDDRCESPRKRSARGHSRADRSPPEPTRAGRGLRAAHAPREHRPDRAFQEWPGPLGGVTRDAAACSEVRQLRVEGRGCRVDGWAETKSSRLRSLRA